MLNSSFEKIKNINVLTQVYDHCKLMAFIIITSGYLLFAYLKFDDIIFSKEI